MKLAFERRSFYPWWTRAGSLDRIIGWWTQSPYCHVETVFDRLIPAHGLEGPGAMSFSATFEAGVRFCLLYDLEDPKHWTLVDLPVTADQEGAAFAYAHSLVGRSYNALGLLRFAVGPIKDPTNEDFCSQVSLLVCESIGLWTGTPAERVDPGFLYDLAIAIGKPAQ